MITVQSLWIGPPTTLEKLCIASHLAQGHEFVMYSYEPLAWTDWTDERLIIKDASDILPSSRIFKVQDRFAGFSDLFRWKLLYEQGGWWTDLDVIALKPFEFNRDIVFASELQMEGADDYPTCSVVKLPADSPVSQCFHLASENTDPESMDWGDIGPSLCYKVVKEYGLWKSVEPHETFCPLTVNRWREVLNSDPPAISESAYAVHLWNAMWTGLGGDPADKDAQYHETCLYEQWKRKFL